MDWIEQEIDNRCLGCTFVVEPRVNSKGLAPVATCLIFVHPKREWARNPELGCLHFPVVAYSPIGAPVEG